MAKIKPIKINLVEQDGWKNWDYASSHGISEWASDNAWDDWTNMDSTTCRDYVQDLINAALPKKQRLKFSLDELERICEEMQEERYDHFESVSQAIIDAHQWAWEVAYTPDDKDIKIAMEKAERNWDWDFRMAGFWDFIQREQEVEGPREWSPRPPTTWTMNQLFDQLIERIRYEREKDHYDRFLVFDWGDSPAVKRLLEVLKTKPNEGGPMEVEAELDDLVSRYLKVFFTELEDRMQDKDIHIYWDLDPHWENVLKDKSRMIGIRKELEEFLTRRGEK